MKRNKITINDGIVTIPSNPQMTDYEIAELFGVFTQAVKANIKTVLKLGICKGDYTLGGTVYGATVLPDYYGLDMIMALAFRIDSQNARVFREYIAQQLVVYKREPLYIQIPQNAMPN